MSDETSEEIVEIYFKALKFCSELMAKTYGLSIEEHRLIDPTIGEMAKILGNLADVVEILAVAGNYDDEDYKINLMQLGVIMKLMEKALQNDDKEDLEKLKIELNNHLNVPK